MDMVDAQSKLGEAMHVNGVPRPVDAAADRSLASHLRDVLGMTGTKIGCAVGECGACTVLLDDQPVCACLVPVGRCAGRSVRTIEGVAAPDGGMHPVQRALVERGAFQCGYCTPGMVMSVVSLWERGEPLSRQEIQQALQGNVCRCSGYVKLLDTVEALLAERSR